MKEGQKPTVLPALTARQAVVQAKEEIEKERQGKQLGLMVRWNSANIAMRKGFRFNHLYLLAGLSGSGKSYLLNEILNDFMDMKGINKNFEKKVIFLYFCYEMSAYNEILRTLGSKTKMSYNRILNSEWDRETKTYKGLTDDELKYAFSMLDNISNRPIYYFETAGNLAQLERTVDVYAEQYPGWEIVVAIDHTLLSEKLDERTDIELMANTGKTAIRIKKKHKAMIIMLGQLNNNIENFQRITNVAHHYPVKSDIYAQGQLYNACDVVMTIHQPAALKIAYYGAKKRKTDKLMHWLVLKARFGKVGSIWLENHLDQGELREKSFVKIDEIREE